MNDLEVDRYISCFCI